MNVDKAKSLLEKLRMRTEARGATAAEAAQAAELADKLAKRYGLDQQQRAEVEDECEIKYKRFPGYCYWLVRAIEKRFHCSANVYNGRSMKNAKVVFVGAEHDVSIACWLFRAVLNDLHRQANKQARANHCRGGDLVRFRNAFIDEAAFEVYFRLNPPKELTPEKRAKIDAEVKAAEAKSRKRKRKPLTRDQLAKLDFERRARFAGAEAGESVQLGTNVVGSDKEPMLLN